VVVLVADVEPHAGVGLRGGLAQLGTKLDPVATCHQLALAGAPAIATYLARFEQPLDLRAREREPITEHAIEPRTYLLFLNIKLLHRADSPALLGAP
jgi:hypothetical protein